MSTQPQAALSRRSIMAGVPALLLGGAAVVGVVAPAIAPTTASASRRPTRVWRLCAMLEKTMDELDAIDAGEVGVNEEGVTVIDTRLRYITHEAFCDMCERVPRIIELLAARPALTPGDLRAKAILAGRLADNALRQELSAADFEVMLFKSVADDVLRLLA